MEQIKDFCSVAKKLGEPQLNQIRLYDLRHFAGSMAYHRTKDIIFTMRFMGHKNIKTFNPTKSRIRALRLGPIKNLAVACRHCEDPACVAACPRDALSQEEDTGITIVDEEVCHGCAWFISACQLGPMIMHPDKKSGVHMQQLQRPN